MIRRRCLILFFLMLSCNSSAALGTVVGVYNSEYPRQEDNSIVTRIAGLGYTTYFWTAPSDITADSLSQVDVFFITSSSACTLLDAAPAISGFVMRGGGLIIEQPNFNGPVAILPPGLGVSIYSYSYDGSRRGADPVRNAALTTVGMKHPITRGLVSSDICQNMDKVRRHDFSPFFRILAVQQSNPDLVAVAVAEYGAGRVIFETGNISPASMSPGSDAYVKRMLDWAAVRKPTSLIEFAIGYVIMAFPSARHPE